MAGPLEVFEAAVFEAVFEIMSVKDGDAACDIVAVGLAEVVDGLAPMDALEFIAPNAPRLIPDDEGVDGAAAMVVNDFWYRNETFAPIYYAVAREYYERVRPSAYPAPPVATIRENDAALFGCELVDMKFESGREGTQDAAMVLWAGCAAASVRFCFQKSIAMPLGYALLFAFVSASVP
ncbi:hypothetical protein [Pontitalea aquivivens]|uniref:hypothetical protein n=1 Tax=Pontitalea aquivivens TaxID=3388663 RepID=UPI0039710C3F